MRVTNKNYEEKVMRLIAERNYFRCLVILNGTNAISEAIAMSIKNREIKDSTK